VALGETLIDAFDLIDALNKAAKMLFLCLSTGLEPIGLKEEDFLELDEAFGNMK
jgi:ribulose-5-phosphate 4-epimerase/fuculose-1-phosphate aldolase